MAVCAIIAGYKQISGVYAVEKQIRDMAVISSPTKEDIESFQAAYNGLSPQAQKLVGNYDDYLAVYDSYIQNLVDSFPASEEYAQVEKIVSGTMSKYVDAPVVSFDADKRELVIDMVAGADTEYYLLNDPTQVQSYLETLVADLQQVTGDAFQLSSLYGIDVRAEVDTDGTDGLVVIKVKNGALEYYVLGENQ